MAVKVVLVVVGVLGYTLLVALVAGVCGTRTRWEAERDRAKAEETVSKP